METLREIISKIDTNKSNLTGSKESFDNLTIHDVYKIAETKIKEMCLEYNMNNFWKKLKKSFFKISRNFH